MPATGQQTHFDVCSWLSDGSKADILLFPVVFVVLIIWYFSSIFIVVAWELWSSYNRQKHGLAGPQHRKGPGRYVAELTVKQEAEYFRWAKVLEGVCTVSMYSCMTVRGAQALGLFTASTAFVVITLSAFRHIFVAETLTTLDIAAAHCTFFGNAVFVLVGFVQTMPPEGTSLRTGEQQVFRKFNVTFTGAVSTTGRLGKTIISMCHSGGVLCWVFCSLAATYLQLIDDETPDNSPFISLQAMWNIQRVAVGLFFFANFLYMLRPKGEILGMVPVFVSVFITEVLAVVALSVGALLQEYQPIYNCVNFSSHVCSVASIALVGGIGLQLVSGFYLQQYAEKTAQQDAHNVNSDTEIARYAADRDIQDDYSPRLTDYPLFSRDFSREFSRDLSRRYPELSKTR